MAQTLKEKIGKKELFHETLSDKLGDIEVTIEFRFICISDGENSVLLSIDQMNQLLVVGPKVIKKAKEIERG
jgi:hypothetical protein